MFCSFKNEKTIIRINTQTLGDYSHNNNLDGADIDSILSYWNSDIATQNNVNIDLAPVTGLPPHFHSLPDGVWDIDDIMVFIRNWKWFQENPPIFKREKIDYTPDFGLPIEMEIINLVINSVVFAICALRTERARLKTCVLHCIIICLLRRPPNVITQIVHLNLCIF